MTATEKEKAPSRNGAGTQNVAPESYSTGSVRSRARNELRKTALALAGKGRSIFPCNAEKKPITKHGFKDASTDCEKIQQWWTQYPTANLGMPTGSVNEVVVLDVDCDETKKLNGEKSLAELVEHHEPLPATLTAKTPRGGRHFYFQHPGTPVPCSTGKLGEGLDVRGDGGYVLLPPSRTDRGAYEYLDRSPLAPLPEWLRGLMVNGAARTSATEQMPIGRPTAPGVPPTVAELIGAGAGEGIRNERAFWIATQLRDEGHTQSVVGSHVLQFAGRCQPPLPNDEAMATVASAFKGVVREPARNPNKPGSAGEVTSEEWPEPQPLPVELPDVQPFNFLCLPETLRPWIQDISDRMQCPPDYPAVGAVVALGSLIGRKVGIRPKRYDDWLVIPNLWGMAVGRPGLMKTPALDQAMAPLNRLVAQAIERHENEMRGQNISAMLQEQRAKLAQKEILGLLKSGNEKDARDIAERSQKEADSEPVLRRYVVNDSTVEKLGELLNQNPNGLLVHRDELVGFLRALDKEGREDSRAFYLEAWNGTGSFTCDRIMRGTLRIEAVTVSILGAIQPGPLQEYLRQATKNGAGDDGLLQRFQLAVWPDSPKEWRNIDRWPDTQAKNEAFEVFKYLDELTAEKVGADTSNVIPFLRFSGDAQATFDAWRAELEVDLRSNREHEALEAHLAKYRKLVPALALILHLADRGKGPVTLRALEKSLLWATYLESHARRLYSAVLRPDMVSARELAKHIKQGDLSDVFTLRETYRNGWIGLAAREDAEAATDILSNLGWIRQLAGEPSTKGGRPAGATFAINPRIRILQDTKTSSVGGFVSSVSSFSKVNEIIPPPSVEKYKSLRQGTDKTDKTLIVEIAVSSEKVEEDLF